MAARGPLPALLSLTALLSCLIPSAACPVNTTATVGSSSELCHLFQAWAQDPTECTGVLSVTFAKAGAYALDGAYPLANDLVLDASGLPPGAVTIQGPDKVDGNLIKAQSITATNIAFLPGVGGKSPAALIPVFLFVEGCNACRAVPAAVQRAIHAMADVTLTNCTLSGFTRAPNGERPEWRDLLVSSSIAGRGAHPMTRCRIQKSCTDTGGGQHFLASLARELRLCYVPADTGSGPGPGTAVYASGHATLDGCTFSHNGGSSTGARMRMPAVDSSSSPLQVASTPRPDPRVLCRYQAAGGLCSLIQSRPRPPASVPIPQVRVLCRIHPYCPSPRAMHGLSMPYRVKLVFIVSRYQQQPDCSPARLPVLMVVLRHQLTGEPSGPWARILTGASSPTTPPPVRGADEFVLTSTTSRTQRSWRAEQHGSSRGIPAAARC
jgi:hypothetical protein